AGGRAKRAFAAAAPGIEGHSNPAANHHGAEPADAAAPGRPPRHARRSRTWARRWLVRETVGHVLRPGAGENAFGIAVTYDQLEFPARALARIDEFTGRAPCRKNLGVPV